MINTEKGQLYEEATRTRGTAILLLLRRPLRDAATFCALEKTETQDSQEEAPGTTIALREERAHTSENPVLN
jgi:hypothetical protein